jgi:PLP dependent protein
VTSSAIADNLRHIRKRIEAAEQRVARHHQVTLVAVSKTVASDRIAAAYDAGQHVFGENRVQEGSAKVAELSLRMPGAEWHLIGHLQGNKARAAAEAFSLIESVDSIELARRLDRLAAQSARRLPVLVEINVAAEPSKHGFGPDAFRAFAGDLLTLDHLDVRGLMTVAPLVSDPEEARPFFRAMRDLRDWAHNSFPRGNVRELSMGMSGDFEVAIEEGATMVRIGRALFGERPSVEL